MCVGGCGGVCVGCVCVGGCVCVCERGVGESPQTHNPMLTLFIKGPYADHILIPQGSTRSSTFFDIK